MQTPPYPASTTETGLLQQHWQAEAVRLREAHWAPLEDQAATQAALQQPAQIEPRILARAAWLAAHSGLDKHLAQWAQGARWSLAALWLGAFLAGIGTAASALGPSSQAVNLGVALMALLGLHALSFLIWLGSFLPGKQGATTLSRSWLWLTRRLARGPDSALATQAFLSLLGRAKAWKPALGLISHGTWTAAYLGAIPALIILLSTRQYSFHWETTLLSTEAFIRLTKWLGYLPQLLGFPLPAGPEIASSVGLPTVSASTQADWSLWLIGCVVVWGLLLRLLALVVCLALLRQRLTRLHIDPGLPGWLELRDRLLPTHQALGIDRPAPQLDASLRGAQVLGNLRGQAAILGYEMGSDLPWPPTQLPSDVLDLGCCNSRTDRIRIRTQLQSAPAHLLLVCDARLTPDRGTITWLKELEQLCPDLQILCLGGSDTRRQAWQETLRQHGLRQTADLAHWLAYIRNLQHG